MVSARDGFTDEELLRIVGGKALNLMRLSEMLAAGTSAGEEGAAQENEGQDAAETSKAKALAEASEALEQFKRDASTREAELREAAHQDIMRERDLAEKATAQAPDAAAIRAALVEEFKGTWSASEQASREVDAVDAR